MQETLRKRKLLDGYCAIRKCDNCPLNRCDCRCGRGYHFLSKDNGGVYKMSNEEIEYAYKIAFGKSGTGNMNCVRPMVDIQVIKDKLDKYLNLESIRVVPKEHKTTALCMSMDTFRLLTATRTDELTWVANGANRLMGYKVLFDNTLPLGDFRILIEVTNL